MTKIPEPYTWLEDEPAPRILVAAIDLYGIKEFAGRGNNPLIMDWVFEVGEKTLGAPYTADETPWCGLFMAVCAKRAGVEIPRIALRARSWAVYGNPSPRPSLGDVLVFGRQGGGHVGLYVGEDKHAFHVLGGNQGDAVSIVRIAKGRLLAARRTAWRVGQPPNVRPVFLGEGVDLSENEA